MFLHFASVLVFVFVVLGTWAGLAIYRDLMERDHGRVRARLGQEFPQAGPEETPVAAKLFPSMNTFDVGALARPGGEEPSAPPPPKPLQRWLEVAITQSGLGVTPRQIVIGALAAGLVFALLGLALFGVVTGAACFVAGAAVPFTVVRMRQGARRERFLSQLPEAFELMARVLRAGHSVPQSFQTVADSTGAPLAGEFRRCQEQQNLGLLPELAYAELAERTGLLETKIFVMAMTIQRQTGGNLSDVLERLGGLIRERARLRGHIRTLTAEGRLQAVVLLVLPPLLFLVMRFLNPQYADVLLVHKRLLAATGATMAVGALWIRKIVQLEV